jgi:hypothetical protein
MQLLCIQGCLKQTGCQGRADHLLGVMADHHTPAVSRGPHLHPGVNALQLVANQLELSGAELSRAMKPEPMGQLMANGQRAHGSGSAHLAALRG